MGPRPAPLACCWTVSIKPYTDGITAAWLAREIFKAFPNDCPGLRIYELDCGCIYYRRVFQDGREDEQTGIPRNPAHSAYEVCMTLPKE